MWQKHTFKDGASFVPTNIRKDLIDNLDISKVDLYSLRKQIGFVPQDCLLFEGNIFSNIALGDPHAESEKIIEMAKIACAHEFIMELPYGYSTPVGEKGSGLSGGHRQRIALARMLLENPRMIVLDEATSALDVNTERQVVNNLKSYLTGRTCLMITHRLSTLIEADQIIVMHAGRVDEMGTHSELMKLKGRILLYTNHNLVKRNRDGTTMKRRISRVFNLSRPKNCRCCCFIRSSSSTSPQLGPGFYLDVECWLFGDIAMVHPHKVEETVILTGEISTEKPGVQVTARDPGIISAVNIKLHQKVEAGDILIIYKDDETEND